MIRQITAPGKSAQLFQQVSVDIIHMYGFLRLKSDQGRIEKGGLRYLFTPIPTLRISGARRLSAPYAAQKRFPAKRKQPKRFIVKSVLVVNWCKDRIYIPYSFYFCST